MIFCKDRVYANTYHTYTCTRSKRGLLLQGPFTGYMTNTRVRLFICPPCIRRQLYSLSNTNSFLLLICIFYNQHLFITMKSQIRLGKEMIFRFHQRFLDKIFDFKQKKAAPNVAKLFLKSLTLADLTIEFIDAM